MHFSFFLSLLLCIFSAFSLFCISYPSPLSLFLQFFFRLFYFALSLHFWLFPIFIIFASVFLISPFLHFIHSCFLPLCCHEVGFFFFRLFSFSLSLFMFFLFYLFLWYFSLSYIVFRISLFPSFESFLLYIYIYFYSLAFIYCY